MPGLVAQVSGMRDGLRVAGIRDPADDNADPGLPADDVLHANYEAPTPTSVLGARTILTPDLAALIEQRKPLVLDPNPWAARSLVQWGYGVPASAATYPTSFRHGFVARCSNSPAATGLRWAGTRSASRGSVQRMGGSCRVG